MENQPCCRCEGESDYGTHCVSGGQVTTLDWCATCYNKVGREAYQTGKYLKFIKNKETQHGKETQLRLL